MTHFYFIIHMCKFHVLEIGGADAPLFLAPAEGFEDSWPTKLDFYSFSVGQKWSKTAENGRFWQFLTFLTHFGHE